MNDYARFVQIATLCGGFAKIPDNLSYLMKKYADETLTRTVYEVIDYI